ncbi:hypothetical protein [Comamonas humi]
MLSLSIAAGFGGYAAPAVHAPVAVPYVQPGTLLKVRFRGPANSDDLLDFSVFLGPGDRWSASNKETP